MLKGLSRLWWRGVKRVNKAQHSQGKKLVKALLAPPAKRSRPKTSRPKSTASSTVTLSAASKPKVGGASGQLPGKWLAGYCNVLARDGQARQPRQLHARRISYWLYLPDRESIAGLPLVVMLHGCDQTATQFAAGTRMNHLAEKKGFAVLYPQQSLRSHSLRCWPWFEKSNQHGGGDVQLITGAIDKVAQQYAIDPTRIYVAGLSAGAAMAHIVALTHPHRIAAVGLHSGPVFGAGHTRMGAYAVMQGGSIKASGSAIEEVSRKFGGLPRMPAILMHGEADHVVRPINQMQLVQQFKILNRLGPEHAAPLVFKPAKGGTKNPSNPYRLQDYVVAKKLLLRVCEVFHLDHAWSGGDCELKYNACNGPDASKMMWDFFARHRRVTTPSSDVAQLPQ
jgi:poly(hydroxyalkanoate) depolymerase family esterase